MNSTWFNIAVVLLWLTAMGWLISQKVVPALLVGEPPSYRTVVEAQQEDPRVGWAMSWNQRRIGWAMNKVSPLPDELTEVRSLVRFEDLPLREMTPPWLRKLLFAGEELPSGLEFQIRSKLVFDPLQRLSQFESAVGFQSADDVVKVQGTLDGSQLRVSIRYGDFTDDVEILLPPKAILSDAFSPQTQLPGLREGQTWSVRVYSPLRPRNSPEEILQAKVEGRATVFWDGRMVDTWVVVYRSDPGAGTANTRSPRGKLWVRKDGTVLKQQVTLFDTTLTFDRMPEAEAAALAETIGDW